jgi:ParB family transcriptional regulator, chromosome partitioning protein
MQGKEHMKTKKAKIIEAVKEQVETIITSIPHDQLMPWLGNPRKQKRDEKKLVELADSIAENGVLHNLTARRVGEAYELAIGEGRYLAVRHLIKTERVPKDYPMPVCVRELSDLDMLELATSENIQRADMHPLDEAKAFADMVKLGRDVDSVALKMGLSKRTVEQRLAIASKLSPKIKKAFAKDEITLAQAQQLTCGSFEFQEIVLEHIQAGHALTPDEIKSFFASELMAVSKAIFDVSLYKGEITNNLFDEGHEPLFIDSEQARRLQLEAIEAKRKAYAETWAWVEVTNHYDFKPWIYQHSEERDPSSQGMVIVFNPSTMEVQIEEGLTRREADSSHRSAEKNNEPKTPPAYTKRLLSESRKLKTIALQTELSKDYRTCLIVAIMGLLGCSEVKLNTDIPSLGSDFKTPKLEETLKPHLEVLKEVLGEHNVKPYPLQTRCYGDEQVKVYEYLKTLENKALRILFNTLIAATFGSWTDYEPKPGDRPLANAVARDLNIDMTRHFTLTQDFLKGYRKPGLIELLREMGFNADFSTMTSAGLAAFISSCVKDKTYLPSLVQFFEETDEQPKAIIEELKKAA